jgi:hypothetical protein
MRCSFGSVTVNESISPSRVGRSLDSRQPLQGEIPDHAVALECPSVVMRQSIARGNAGSDEL